MIISLDLISVSVGELGISLLGDFFLFIMALRSLDFAQLTNELTYLAQNGFLHVVGALRAMNERMDLQLSTSMPTHFFHYFEDSEI